MIVKKFLTGIFQVNTYLIADEETKEAVLIDLGGNFDSVYKEIQKDGLNLKYILNTHGHFDHISGEKEAQDKANIPVYIHENDKFLVDSLEMALVSHGFPVVKPPEITGYIDESSYLKIGNIPIKVIETPGHSKGSVCFLAQNSLFSGDTLFLESIGRTDLIGGDFEEIKNSVLNKLLTLPEDTIVYPGHDDSTTIARERVYNYLVR